MALAIITTRAGLGLDAPEVLVEVHLSNGLPGMTLVGLPETAVRESRERVRSALLNAGFEFPTTRRITINLAPADLPKEGGRFDLPIALGILVASEQVPATALEGVECLGELALDGRLRPVTGVLPAALAVKARGRGLLVAAGNADEAALAGDLQVLPAEHLSQVVAHLLGQARLEPHWVTTPTLPEQPLADLADVRGQYQARRAFCRRCRPTRRSRSRRSARCAGSTCSNAGVSGRFARRTTPPAAWRWSAAVRGRAPARSRWRIKECCFSTSCRNSTAACSR